MRGIKGFLIDLDGVVYQNSQPIPGAIETLQWLETHRVPHLFVTNTTSKPRAAIVHKLQAMGLEIAPSQILTPVVAAVSHLQENGAQSVVPFLVEATQEDLDGVTTWLESDSAPPDAILLGDIGEQWTFAKLNQAFQHLMANPNCELLAMGMTRYFKGAKGLQLDVGPFVQALAYAVDREPVVLGKPAKDFFLQACRQLQLDPAETCMIGDDARSDVAAAQLAGLKGALVQTGKFLPSDLKAVEPDFLLETFADIRQWSV